MRNLRKIYSECGSTLSEIRFQLKENRRVRKSGALKPPRTPALVETKSDSYPPSLVNESDVAPPKLVDEKSNSTEFDGKLVKRGHSQTNLLNTTFFMDPNMVADVGLEAHQSILDL